MLPSFATAQHPGPGLRRLGLGVLLVLAVLVATAAAAWSHAEVEGSEPHDDAHLDGAPAQARVWFDGPVEPVGVGLQVVGPEGIRVDRDDTAHGEGPHELVLSLEDGLPAGDYTASWRVQAGDSHVQEGSWSFTVDAGPATTTSDAAPDTTPMDTAGRPPAGQDHHDPATAEPEALAAVGEPDTRVPGVLLGLAALGGLVAAAGALLVVHRARGAPVATTLDGASRPDTRA